MEADQTMNDTKEPMENLQSELIPELRNIQGSESKFGSLTLLIVTLIIFFSAGIISVKWQEILILIGVLFFHEAGHFLAMKLLKYNDVKMFFIPLIGAAVSGKNENETAVKSCIVSFMGPLPGIILGVILYFLFGFTKNYYILKTAQVMLLLNAFNFLPIMPLDGGRYIDVLFIDRRYFRLLFALLGASLFILLGVLAKDIIIGLIGIFLVFSAFSSFKLYGISKALKAEGFNARSINELINNENLLKIVIHKLYEKYPKLFKPKMVYRAIFNQLTTIVDTLKFVPARIVSKSALLIIYVVMVLSSMGVTFFFMAMDYKEVAKTEIVNGTKRAYVELYLFGEKRSKYSLNDSLFYHGEGVAYWSGSETVSDIFYYSDGYRTGEWTKFNNAGEPVEKKVYDRGRLVSVSKMEDGRWINTNYEDLSIIRKSMEKIQRISQPFKSNYKHFEE